MERYEQVNREELSQEEYDKRKELEKILISDGCPYDDAEEIAWQRNKEYFNEQAKTFLRDDLVI